jgi:short-subunit dehydrogenase
MKVIILGGASAIAEACARRFAKEGADLLLAGRDGGKLSAIADDLRVVGAQSVETEVLDLAAPKDASASLKEMRERLGGCDLLLLAYGVLGDERGAEKDLDEAEQLLQTNFTSAAGWLMAGAEAFEEQGHGSLVAIGSVAGDRGRQSNYLYGAAKGGLALLMQGLAHRFAGSEIKVLTVKPGFVDTPMTAAFDKGPLWASPEQIAAGICKAVAKKESGAIYLPWFWFWIMMIIRNLPAFLLHKTKL